MVRSKIIYTWTDEAPALATVSLLPVITAFTEPAGVIVETRDISLAGRILAAFPDHLRQSQRQSDDLTELGALAKTPEANIIKLPNISASIPQLHAAIEELQSQGFGIPNYPEEPMNTDEEAIKVRYARVLGSAVNPVLREGNSDRRVAAPVKEYARKHPHSMGAWSADSKTHVSHMQDGDFFSSEQSVVIEKPGLVRIELLSESGDSVVLKPDLEVLKDEVIDGSVMRCKALCAFYARQIKQAKADDVLLSLHLKATMMKISDPILFGHAVTVYFGEVFEKYTALFKELGVDPNNGLGDVYAKIKNLTTAQQAEIEADIQAVYSTQPKLAMVDSDKGITNLHVPSDVIIDASMPAAIRASGKMWGPDGLLHDSNMMIPDRCYAGIYQETIDFCKKNGAFDVTTMGNVCNVGLMAQKAEEYGSHDKTFEIPEDGTLRVIDHTGKCLMEHQVEQGDVWRMCQTKDLPIRDWVKLGVKRARETGSPAVFWLTPERAHDAKLIQKVKCYLVDENTAGLTIKIMAPDAAIRYTLQRAKEGKDTISVTGNILRDYLTDLFPILELGTSAKMLSIVPLLAGGGMYETGAGGSAPKHIQQFLKEGHLRWDSLGEYLALAISLEDLAQKTGNQRARILANALNRANSQFLNQSRSPSRKVGELDTRGSHFYLTMYWAQAMASQNEDTSLQALFSPLATQLQANEEKIVAEINATQGCAQDIGGYYHGDEQKTVAAMRPSATLNTIIAAFAG
ncbi:MAG TPA: NADP-dependent isocitrate dehydrogenase [Gammaproteobacteria bacterium]|nr:NADP-dependent isocitrate dehydrogenase [Gammaproteobacteria bacterium]